MQSFYSLGKDKIKVLLLEGVHKTAVGSVSGQRLCHAGLSRQGAARGGIVRGDCRCAHCWYPLAHPVAHRTVFAAARKLMAVGCFCIGTQSGGPGRRCPDAACRCSMRRFPTPARWPNWCWRKMLMRGIPSAMRCIAAAG